MHDALLTRKKGGYVNEDVIFNTLRYIFRFDNRYHYYYGVWPPTPENAIEQFKMTRTVMEKQKVEKQVQHLCISFSERITKDIVIRFSEHIALMFAAYYQTCFALHDNTDHLHCHFVISTTSYIIENEPLTDCVIEKYCLVIKNIAALYDILLQEMIK